MTQSPTAPARTEQDLIARLEGLSGPDRDVADAVLLACGWSVVLDVIDHNPVKLWRRPDGARLFRIDVPDPTASVDAALTLVPEGCAPIMKPCFVSDGIGFWAEILRVSKHLISPVKQATGQHSNLPIALCIAALKARGATP